MGGENLFFFFLNMAALVAYGTSQARGQIGAAVEATVIATATSEVHLSFIYDLCHTLRQCQILNPLSKARECASSQILHQVLNPASHKGNSRRRESCSTK